MIKRAVLALSAAALLASCSDGPPPSVRALMKDDVQPTADIFWKSSGSVSDETGDHDLTPTTPEGWKKAEDATKHLVELGELLKTEDYAQGRGEGWLKFADGMIDMSKQAEAAVKSRNSDKMFEVGAYLYDVCSACHQAYPATEAAAAGVKE
jgi:hypothetical protein